MPSWNSKPIQIPARSQREPETAIFFEMLRCKSKISTFDLNLLTNSTKGTLHKRVRLMGLLMNRSSWNTFDLADIGCALIRLAVSPLPSPREILTCSGIRSRGVPERILWLTSLCATMGRKSPVRWRDYRQPQQQRAMQPG